MINKTKIYCFLIFLIVFSTSPIVKADALNINAKSYILVDFNTGRILAEKNSDKKQPMASTTKIMTAIIALENGDLSSKVKVSKRAASVGGSSFGLAAGDEISLENMLYGLLLCSGNDAAIAISEHIAGNVENFVKMMNEKAIDIGALNTHFENPHGLDSPYHYSTAKDLVKISCYAWRNPKFREIVGTNEKIISEENFKRKIHNTNKLVRQFKTVNGIKTGYTSQAGKCLVSSAVKNKLHLISVVLGAQDHFSTSQKLLKFGFSNFTLKKIIKAQENYSKIEIENGIKKELSLMAEKDISIPIAKKDSIDLKIVALKKIRAPVYKYQPIGELQVFINGNYICSTPLVASEELRELSIVDMFYNILKHWFNLNSNLSNILNI